MPQQLLQNKMNLAKFGFSELDVNFSAPAINGIYLINANNKYINYYLSLQIMLENVKNGRKVLFFSDCDFSTLKDFAVNIDINSDKFFESNYLLLLQYPKNLKEYFKNSEITTLFLQDIDTYLKEFDPNIIIFDKIDKFLSNDEVELDSFRNRFLSLLKKRNSIVYLLSYHKEKIDFGGKYKYFDGIFNINYSSLKKDKNTIVFTNHNNKEIKLHLDLTSSGIIINQISFRSPKFFVKNMAIVYFPEILKYFKKDMESIFGKSILCIEYHEEKDINLDKYNVAQTSLILPDWIGEPSVFRYTKKLLSRYPKLSIFFLVSKFTSYSHKIRAKKMGVKGFFEMPARVKEIDKLFTNKYKKITDDIIKRDLFTIIFDKDNIFYEEVYDKESLSKELLKFSNRLIFKEEGVIILLLHSKLKFDEEEIKKHINFKDTILIIDKKEDDFYKYIVFIRATDSSLIQEYRTTILNKFNVSREIDVGYNNFEKNVLGDIYLTKTEKPIVFFNTYFFPFENTNFKNILKEII